MLDCCCWSSGQKDVGDVGVKYRADCTIVSGAWIARLWAVALRGMSDCDWCLDDKAVCDIAG